MPQYVIEMRIPLSPLEVCNLYYFSRISRLLATISEALCWGRLGHRDIMSY